MATDIKRQILKSDLVKQNHRANSNLQNSKVPIHFRAIAPLHFFRHTLPGSYAMFPLSSFDTLLIDVATFFVSLSAAARTYISPFWPLLGIAITKRRSRSISRAFPCHFNRPVARRRSCPCSRPFISNHPIRIHIIANIVSADTNVFFIVHSSIYWHGLRAIQIHDVCFDGRWRLAAGGTANGIVVVIVVVTNKEVGPRRLLRTAMFYSESIKIGRKYCNIPSVQSSSRNETGCSNTIHHFNWKRSNTQTLDPCYGSTSST